MSVNTERKQELVEEYQVHESDSGSTEVQVALLTEQINNMTDHLEEHPQDHSCQQGLQKLVGKRNSLLDYLKEQDISRYNELVESLGLRAKK